jgi:hypothetical protein
VKPRRQVERASRLMGSCASAHAGKDVPASGALP